MPNKNRPYKVVKHETGTFGRFSIISDTIEIDDKQYPYSYINGGSYVQIIPIYREKVCLIRQYRHALNSWYYEFPAGGISMGENPIETAARELSEETGLEGKLIEIAEIPGAQGTSNEIVHMFLAICDKKNKKKSEPTELIEILEVTEVELDQMILDRRFTQLSGIAEWYYYKIWKTNNSELKLNYN